MRSVDLNHPACLEHLTAANLLLAKVEDSNELVESWWVAKVVEVFPNVLFALSVTFSVHFLHPLCGLVAAFKPIHKDGS